jgi:hypothetical protein
MILDVVAIRFPVSLARIGGLNLESFTMNKPVARFQSAWLEALLSIRLASIPRAVFTSLVRS